MLKQLDRYILRRFFAILFTTLLAFIILFIVVDVVENMDKYIDARMPRRAVISYYFYTIPWFISIGLPMAMLLSTVFSLGMLQKRNEITAMKSSGLSIHRIGASLLIVGLFVSTGSFFFEDQVVSEGIRKKSDLQAEYLAHEYKRDKNVRKQDIFLQQSSVEHIAIDRFDYRNQKAVGVSIQHYMDGQLVSRLDLRNMVWDDTTEVWRGKDYTIRLFDGNPGEAYTKVTGRDTLLTLTLKPTDLVKMSVSPDEMRYIELKDFIGQLVRNGVDPTRWEVNLHFKVAFACTSFIMVLFGLPFSVGRPRTSMAFGAGMSIFIIFAYYAAIKLGQSLGIKGVLEPLVSVWLPNLVFLLGGFILLLRSRS